MLQKPGVVEHQWTGYGKVLSGSLQLYNHYIVLAFRDSQRVSVGWLEVCVFISHHSPAKP